MTFVIKHCRGEKKRWKKNRLIQKKIKDSRILDFRMSRTQSQIKNRKHFANEKTLEEYNVRIYEIDLYFYEHYVEPLKVNKMDVTTYHLELMIIFLNLN